MWDEVWSSDEPEFAVKSQCVKRADTLRALQLHCVWDQTQIQLNLFWAQMSWKSFTIKKGGNGKWIAVCVNAITTWTVVNWSELFSTPPQTSMNTRHTPNGRPSPASLRTFASFAVNSGLKYNKCLRINSNNCLANKTTKMLTNINNLCNEEINKTLDIVIGVLFEWFSV